MDYVVLGLLFAYLVYNDYRNYHERQKLMDRLMSRDYTDYFAKELESKTLTMQTKRIHDKHPDHIQL